MKTRFVTAIILTGIFAGSASAGVNVLLHLDSDKTVAGAPISGVLVIQNAAKVEAPEFPEIDDVTVSVTPLPKPYFFPDIANDTGEKVKSYVYVCKFTPLKPGKYVIPEFGVKADGKTYYTRPVTFTADKSDDAGGECLIAEIVPSKKQVYVGEELKLTLKIYVKPFFSRRYNIRPSPDDMFHCFVVEKCNWGDFARPLQELFDRNRLPRGTEVLKNDKDGLAKSYYLYELEKNVIPTKPGRIEEGGVTLIMNYPDMLGEDFFGRLQVTKVKKITAQAKPAEVEVVDLPTADRPATFTGAIGEYEMDVSALPRIVHVGEPVTLTIKITGKGRMDSLPAPDLANLPELTKDFKVPNEPLAGVVSNGTKTFKTSIRPKNDEVRCIPPISYSYFNVDNGKYVTISSEPIAIMVKPAEKLKMQNIVSANGNGKTETHQETVKSVAGGIFANVTDTDKLLGSGGMDGKGKLALLVAAPSLFAVLAIVRLMIYLGGGAQAKRRRAAGPSARSALSSAKTPEDVAAGILGYVADRIGKVSAGMTCDDAMAELHKWKLPPATLGKVDALLRKCEEARYSAGSAGEMKELTAEAKECLQLIEKR